MDSSWPLATFRIGPARKSSPFDLIIYPLLSTLVRSRWRDIGLAFFAFWLTLTSSRSYPLCQRLFMRGFRFRSTLKKWPTRKACVVDKRVGWVLAKFFFFFSFSWTEIPWLPEVYSCVRLRASSAAGRGHERRSRERKQRGTQGISVYDNAKNNLANIQPSCLSTRMLFAQVTF